MKAFWFFIHTWVHGHSVETRKYVTDLAKEGGKKGWLMLCDCGKTWSR